MKRIVLYPIIFTALAPAPPLGGAFFQPPLQQNPVFAPAYNARQAQFGEGAPTPPAAAAVTIPSVAASAEPVITLQSTVLADWSVPPPAPAAAVTPSTPVATSSEPVISVGFTVIGDISEPPIAPVAAQPYGAFPQDPIKVVYGFPAKLAQDGSDNAPAPFPTFTQPFTQSPEVRWKATFPAFRQQDGSDTSPLPIAIPTPGWQFQWPDLSKPLFRASLQYARDDFPASVIISITPQGFWTQFPALFAKPYPAAQQRFQDFVPLGTIVTPQYIFTQSPDRFWKANYPAQLAPDWSDFTALPMPTAAQYGAFPQYPDLFIKPLRASLQRFQDFTPIGTYVAPQYGAFPQYPDL